jgi:tRNA G18 (ribose-2'-O)-methylase SpoU
MTTGMNFPTEVQSSPTLVEGPAGIKVESYAETEPRVKGKKLKRMQKEFLREKYLNKLASPGVHEGVLVLDHLKPDFNVGKIFRSADAFGMHEIWLVGVPLFHPGPSMGSFRHVPARFFSDFRECHAELVKNGYAPFVFEPVGGESLLRARFPRRSAFIMGHEEFGVSFDKKDYADVKTLTVPQFGKVQSLNVSVAASIAMYEYVRQISSAPAE